MKALNVTYSYCAQICIYLHFSFFFRQIHNTFGVVTSFTGTYKADEWSLTLSSSQGTNTLVMGDPKFHSTVLEN